MFTPVFVYGTLMQGGSNHYLLDEASCLGAFKTRAIYSLVNLGSFPAAIVGGDTPIEGEVYLVSDGELEQLDALEGYPSLYQREKTVVTSLGGNKEKILAYIYFMSKDSIESWDYDPIKSGRWSLDE